MVLAERHLELVCQLVIVGVSREVIDGHDTQCIEVGRPGGESLAYVPIPDSGITVDELRDAMNRLGAPLDLWA